MSRPRIAINLPGADVENPARLADHARQAEQLGFESVWSPDLVNVEGAPALEPLTALAVAAGATERIGLGVGVLALAARPLALIATQIASLQILSGGRLLLGVGLGGPPTDSMWSAAGKSEQQRGRQFDYADPAAFLLTAAQWEPRRDEYCHLVGKPADGAAALAAAEDELHAALADLDAQLSAGDPTGVRLNTEGQLVIPRLAAEDAPSDADALRDDLSGMLPVVSIASLLVEVDARTGFTEQFTHAGGKTTRSPELKRHLLYVLLAEATNTGLGENAASAGISYDALAWTAEWYFRSDTLEAANAAIVNYHHELPFAQVAGTGTLSSSDGQRFPVSGKSITATHLSRYFARGAGISAYTAVSDQHATFDTKVIAANVPEAPLVLDEVLGNATDLPITEHATDTHGATLANFALFDLCGKHLSPRIRDLGKITLTRPGPRASTPSATHTPGRC